MDYQGSTDRMHIEAGEDWSVMYHQHPMHQAKIEEWEEPAVMDHQDSMDEVKTEEGEEPSATDHQHSMTHVKIEEGVEPAVRDHQHSADQVKIEEKEESSASGHQDYEAEEKTNSLAAMQRPPVKEEEVLGTPMECIHLRPPSTASPRVPGGCVVARLVIVQQENGPMKKSQKQPADSTEDLEPEESFSGKSKERVPQRTEPGKTSKRQNKSQRKKLNLAANILDQSSKCGSGVSKVVNFTKERTQKGDKTCVCTERGVYYSMASHHVAVICFPKGLLSTHLCFTTKGTVHPSDII